MGQILGVKKVPFHKSGHIYVAIVLLKKISLVNYKYLCAFIFISEFLGT